MNEVPGLAMLTKVISKLDRTYADGPLSKGAVLAESSNMTGHGTWDLNVIQGWKDVSREDPTAEVIRAYLVGGIKQNMNVEWW